MQDICIMKNNGVLAIYEKLVIAYYKKEYDDINEILQYKDLDWGLFIEQGIKHKVLPLAWKVLKECSSFEDKVPFYLREFLANNYYVNRHKIQMYYKHFSKIYKLFKDNNIKYVVVKGISLEKMLYKNEYIKVISDVDMLINQDDYDIVCDLLKNNEFIAGKYDYVTDTVNEHTRDKYLFFRLTKDHLPDHLIKIDDDVCPVVKIDISTNTDWINKKSNQVFKKIIVENSFELEINNEFSIPVLNSASNFLYMVLHLFRHAWSYRFISRNISIRLSMFNDIILLWFNSKDDIIEELPKLLIDENMCKQVAWVLYHTDDLYGMNLLDELDLKGYVDKTNMSFGKNGAYMKWEGDIRTRLWHTCEKDLFVEVS